MKLHDYCSINDLKESINMKMIKKIYNKVFAPPNSIELATIELEKAKKAFLEAKTHTEYYAAQVEFESIRIKRLEEYVNVIVAAGELTSNPLYQQELPTIVSPTMTLTKPATKKTVTVKLSNPAIKKSIKLSNPVIKKSIKLANPAIKKAVK
jgi:hypothetical protein